MIKLATVGDSAAESGTSLVDLTPLKHDFRVHTSVLRHAKSLSRSTRSHLNTDTEIWVGLIIIGKNQQPDSTDQSPTSLLIRPIQPGLNTDSSPVPSTSTSSPIIQPTSDGWDLPPIRAILGTDQTLLEAVNRCANRTTSKGVKEIVRCLGSAIYPLYSGGNNTGRQVRRYDFLVKLHPGPVRLEEGVEGKWVSADEGWRVMKRLASD